MLGIGLKVASVTVMLLMSSLLKATENIPPGQLAFFRSVFAILPIVLFLAYRRELVDGFKTRRPLAHVGRSLIGVGGMGCGFYALTKLPLPEAISINYTTPLLIVVFGALFLSEKVRLYRWSAVFAGLIGVSIIVWPRLTVFASGGMDETALGAIVALAGCVFAASAMLTVRSLLQTERSATIVLYFSIGCSLMALLTIPFGWVAPTPAQLAMLIGAGIAGGIGQILLTESFRHADVSLVAPFEYTSLIFSIIVGYVFFADIPTVPTLVGGAILVGAGIFIILRERQLGLERRKQKEVATQ
ncbi:DMT family transporter [Devosia sp.]|uniref:DMT family transporter n=1 Tax=Devosia sp. TaxID=1871048 RepID=UPI003A95C466